MAARKASQFSMHCQRRASLSKMRALSTVQPWWSKALFRFIRRSDLERPAKGAASKLWSSITVRHSVASGETSSAGSVEPRSLCTVLRVLSLLGASPKDWMA
eukprot:5483144-Amphidinium_carterae.1